MSSDWVPAITCDAPAPAAAAAAGVTAAGRRVVVMHGLTRRPLDVMSRRANFDTASIVRIITGDILAHLY